MLSFQEFDQAEKRLQACHKDLEAHKEIIDNYPAKILQIETEVGTSIKKLVDSRDTFARCIGRLRTLDQGVDNTFLSSHELPMNTAELKSKIAFAKLYVVLLEAKIDIDELPNNIKEKKKALDGMRSQLRKAKAPFRSWTLVS